MTNTTRSVLAFGGICLLLAGFVLLMAGCSKPTVWAEGTPDRGDHVVNGVRVP